MHFLYDAHLYPILWFDRFKCLILFTNLHFFSIIQRSSMVETDCSSCSWVVSVFASHQYCFYVVKHVDTVYTPSIKKVKSAGKVFCSSQRWTRTNTGCVMRYCMVQTWSDKGFLPSDPILFFKNDIRIRSESCFGWNHIIRFRKLSESVLRCTTYIFVLRLFCLMRQNKCWTYLAFS